MILRRNFESLKSLHQQSIYEVIKQSFSYIVDARADLEIILEYAAKIFSNNDIFSLFKLIGDRMNSCSGFDQQHIPKMSQVSSIDPK